MFVDTHAHLQWASFDSDRKEVITRAREEGVNRVLNVGFDVEGSRKGILFAEQFDGLFAAVGVHPHSASQFTTTTSVMLRDMANNPKVLAIGEIGLDYYRNLSPKEVQRKAFEAQLELAEELKKPVIVHDRDAHIELLQILTRFKGRVRGIMHCFSGSKEMAEKCIELGFLISFAGTITYSNADELREIARLLDLKDMLLETDCPWLAPQRKRGKRNEPSFLPLIAERIAALKDVSLAEVASVTSRNAERILKLPK